MNKIYIINSNGDAISLEELDCALTCLYQRIIEKDASPVELGFAKSIQADLEQIFADY